MQIESVATIFYKGNLISWISKKQPTVALSTAEAEYIASDLAMTELIYIKGVLSDLKLIKKLDCCLYIDNQSTIKFIESYENS